MNQLKPGMMLRYIWVGVVLLIINGSSNAQQTSKASKTIIVEPAKKFQTVKGFGVSLCWWANIMGGWGDSAINRITKDLAGKEELNFNYFRFNIGGGDDPAHHHMRKDGGAMPGYKLSSSTPYDWLADSNQIRIVKKLNAVRPDGIYEAFSNSPPWWMTISGCASGNKDGKENLREDAYGVFADYLTEIVKHFKEQEGITFSRLEPFNEPFSNWWKTQGGQEGCQFLGNSQQKLIGSVYQQLSAKGMLQYCAISAMDANTIDETVKGIKEYPPATINKLSHIATHSYAGTQRTALNQLAQENKKEVWQTESGPLDIKLKGLDNYLTIASRIIQDFKEMGSIIWSDWQAVSLDDGWGLWIYNIDKKVFDRKKPYYIRKQFSKYIKPGYTIIASGGNSIAAINQASDEVVLVIVNEGNNEYTTNLDLTQFAGISPAAIVRTSTTENCNSLPNLKAKNKIITYTVPQKSVTTFIIPVKL